jgi:ribosomal-protein-alanine N-acetyltransferase
MIRVRAAAPSDLARVMAIAGESASASDWPASEYEKVFAAETGPDRLLLVVEENGAEQIGSVQGFVIGHHVAQEWEIENIAVSGPVRRRGLGSLLLEEFLRVVHAWGGTNVYLEVRESNQAARLLYEKAGFVQAGRRKAYYRHPDEDALVLRFLFP